MLKKARERDIEPDTAWCFVNFFLGAKGWWTFIERRQQHTNLLYVMPLSEISVDALAMQMRWDLRYLCSYESSGDERGYRL
jgi:hypothetical protein